MMMWVLTGLFVVESPLTQIPVGTTILLPWWLGRHLASSSSIVFGTPRFLTAKVRESLIADSRCVALREKSPYFYEMCLALSNL